MLLYIQVAFLHHTDFATRAEKVYLVFLSTVSMKGFKRPFKEVVKMAIPVKEGGNFGHAMN